ncbi:adenosylcobinamide-phosphate synthase [Mumia flava]|uniref:Cobalamin biosynthesis protein CobD n=1 Tax=Mumia flava TaxID=1348852 RepID=A0A0B2BUW9_9ACTN|nr:cobalamin biosynthesis protein [Mumia flava]PJJ58018.1 adenosylcobinamide-phosphate synthase [Mumia flava]
MPVARPTSSTALGLVLGFAADRLAGDPRRGHPVALFGTVAASVERRLHADRRRRGIAYALALVGASSAIGVVAERVTVSRPGARTVLVGAATWAVLGGRTLEREAEAVRAHLAAGDLDAARGRVTHLVGRDPTALDAAGVARATVESVAENTSDAVVAPLLAGAVAGVPGLLAYRAANTLDAMVGHRSDRYRRFGWAAARLDDVLNLVPSRLSALLAAIAAPLVGGHPTAAVRAWRRDAHRHPSPNAGPVEAAFAGALGVRLGGVNVYAGVVEDRGTLGDGRAVETSDIVRTVRLARAVGLASLAVAVVLARRRRP